MAIQNQSSNDSEAQRLNSSDNYNTTDPIIEANIQPCENVYFDQKQVNELANTPKWRMIRRLVLGFFWLVWLGTVGLTVFFVMNAEDSVENEDVQTIAAVDGN